MALRVWLLVEWVDESNVFASYGVVNVDMLAYDVNDLNPGNVIYLRLKHESPRQAKILRISENKKYIREQKKLLEDQDQKVKNMLQVCMRTIKAIKSEDSFNTQPKSRSHSAHTSLPHVVVAQNGNCDSDSSSDVEPNIETQRNQNRNIIKPTLNSTPVNNRKQSIVKPVQRVSLNAINSRRTLVSSTPLPSSSSVQQNVTLCYDQGTQTDDLPDDDPLNVVPEEKIEEMETVLKNLYSRFQYLVSQVNILTNGSASTSEFEHIDNGSHIEQNVDDSSVDQNNTGYDEQNNVIPNPIADDVDGEDVDENGVEEQVNSSVVKIEDKFNPNMLRVRRMSAQTTNNVEAVHDGDLVPIGSGKAKVPARLLNEIDWNSHTSATRQLLQAVFPRRVLATHSLTGKQSPAFLHRPPKKILNPLVVEDIVNTVSIKCGVAKNLVRNCITIKCTDEAKLYRNRQQFNQARKPLHQNDENIPPSTPSSDESNTINN